MYSFDKMRELKLKNYSYSEIANELGINRRTVSKYLKQNQPPKYKQREKSGKVDLFIDFEESIKQQLKEIPNWSGEEAYVWLKEFGFMGSLRTVERKLQQIRGEKPKERFFDQEYHPGDQCQFDFKEKIELPFISGNKIVHIHFSTLPYSDACIMKAYPQKNYECFMDGIHSFFELIGGMPRSIRLDNLSPCIKKILPNGKRIYTKAFEAAIMYYGFESLPCSPGRGNEKGDVERDIQTHSRRFLNFVKLTGIVFENFVHLNLTLIEYFTKTLASEKYQQEIKKLNTLPSRDEDVICRIIESRATPFGTLKFMESYYSVPDEVIGINCRMVAGPYEIKVIRLDTNKVVAVHQRVPDGEHQIKLEHIIKSLLRKPRAMLLWSHKEVLFPEPIFRKLYNLIKKQDHLQGAEKEYLKILNLIHNAHLKEITIAVDLVVQNKSINPFEEIKGLLFNESKPSNVIDITKHFNQEPIETNLVGYDQLIPKI